MRRIATLSLALTVLAVGLTAPAQAQPPCPTPNPSPPVVILGAPEPAIPFAGARYSFHQPPVISTSTFYRPGYNAPRFYSPRYLPPGPYFYTPTGPYTPGYYSYYYTPGYFRY